MQRAAFAAGKGFASMETTVLSSSAVAEIAAYGGERIARVHIALAVMLVAGLAFVAETPASGLEVVARMVLAVLLVAQFRLWDDLADRPYDRVHHAERVLVRHAGTDTPFLALLVALSLPIAGLLLAFDDGPWRVGAYGGLALALATIYAVTRGDGARAGRNRLVLLKYPAFGLLPLAHPGAPRALVLAAVAYAAASLYDRLTAEPKVSPPAAPKAVAPHAATFERVACYACGSGDTRPLVTAEEDLTGKPGRFTFVTCANCGLAYQNPRLKIEHIGAYYDDEYIAH